MTSDVTYQCAICDETVEDGRLVAECMACTRTFHLNPYSKGEYKDCGDAIIGPTEGVEFWCQDCLAELDAEATANQPDPRAFLDDVAAQPRSSRGAETKSLSQTRQQPRHQRHRQPSPAVLHRRAENAHSLASGTAGSTANGLAPRFAASSPAGESPAGRNERGCTPARGR